MRDGRDLTGLGLAAVEGAAQDVRLRPADRRHRPPEVGRRRLVRHVPQLPREPPVLDPEEPLTGELEVVPLHVDAPRPVPDHVDPAVDTTDQILGGQPARIRPQRHVGHALHRHVGGGVGVGAPVGPLEAGEPRDPPVQLVPHQPAVLHQVPGLARDALVVVADRRQPVLGGAVAGDVHQLGAVAQRAELFEGGEGGAGVRGLVPEGTVQLGRVPDGLVDGQPQVRRVDDQVVQPRLDAGRPHLLRQQAGHLGQLGVPVPAGPGQVLPPASGRWREGTHGVELAAGVVHRHGGEHGVQPYPLLRGRGPGGVGVELVLVHGEQRGVHVIDPVGRQQPRAPVGQQRRLLRVGHGEGIDPVRRHPGLVGVHGLVRELHPLVRPGRLDHLRRQLRHRHRLRGDPGRGVQGQVHAGREAPRTAVHHPHRVPEVGGVRGPGGPGVPQPQGGAAHPFEPEVGVLGPEGTRAGEGGVGEGAQGECREGLVEVMGHGEIPSNAGGHENNSRARPPVSCTAELSRPRVRLPRVP